MAVIETRREQFQVDYTKERLPGLFYQQESDSNFSESIPRIDSEWLKADLLTTSKLTLLIAVEQLSEKGIIRVLQESADRGVRIYLLLGDERANQAAIDALSGRCLIRTGVTQNGALVLVDHSTNKAQGWLAMNQQIFSSNQAQSWAISLDSDQLDDSFRSFCKLFWEHSSEEYLQQNVSQQKSEHPDKKIITNHSHHLGGALEECLEGTLASLQAVSGFEPDVMGTNYRVLKYADSCSHPGRQGMSLTDQDIPSLIISGQGNWLLPNTTHLESANWCLKLSERQENKIVSAYERAFDEAAWQYRAETRVGELSEEQLLRFSEQPALICQVKALREKELEAISTETLDSFLHSSPMELAENQTGWQRDFISHRINYTLVIHPPYCPSNAQPDGLYDAWKEAEQAWHERISALQHRQQSIEDRQSNAADRLKGFLKSFILGQGQSAKKVNRELADLKQWRVTKATPSERKDYRDHLVRLTEDILSRERHTETELNKAEQHYLWEQKSLALVKKEQQARERVRTEVQTHDALVEQSDSKKRSADKDFTSNWRGAVQALSDEQLKLVRFNGDESERFLPDEMPEEKEKSALDVIRKALLAMDLQAAEKCRQTMKLKVFKKHYLSMDRAIENGQQALKKIERDLEAALKNVQRTKERLANAEMARKNHGAEFEYQTHTGSSAFEQQLGLKGGALNTGFDWPVEELPAAGSELKVDNQRRWLVIKNTDQIDQANRDAQRLNATVCVNRSV